MCGLHESKQSSQSFDDLWNMGGVIRDHGTGITPRLDRGGDGVHEIINCQADGSKTAFIGHPSRTTLYSRESQVQKGRGAMVIEHGM